MKSTSVEKTIDNPYDPSYNKDPLNVSQFAKTLPRAMRITIALVLAPFVLYLLYKLFKYCKKFTRKVRRFIRAIGLPKFIYNVYRTVKKFITNYDSAEYFDDKIGNAEDNIDDYNEAIDDLNHKIRFLELAQAKAAA